MRIISGKFRGKILNDFSHSGTRPTSDKARGGIFNTLIYEIQDGIVLDLFGGTGAMGIEAESRGAKQVYIVDNNIQSIKNIKENCNKCGTTKTTVLYMDYLTALKKLSDVGIYFNVVFLDPPYKEDFAVRAIEKLIEYKMVDSESIIVYEHDNTKGIIENDRIELLKQRKYGIAIVDYYVLAEKEEISDE